MEIREVDQHAGLQDNGLLARYKAGFSLNDPEGSGYTWVETVDLHDDCVEVRHLRGHSCETDFVHGLDLVQEFRENVRALLQFDQCPRDVGADAMVTTWTCQHHHVCM